MALDTACTAVDTVQAAEAIIEGRQGHRARGQSDFTQMAVPWGAPLTNFLSILHVNALQVAVALAIVNRAHAIMKDPMVAMAVCCMRRCTYKRTRANMLAPDEPVGSPALDQPTLYAVAMLSEAQCFAGAQSRSLLEQLWEQYHATPGRCKQPIEDSDPPEHDLARR